MDSKRPFSVLGIQQIAVGGLDKQRLRSSWIDCLGLEYRETFVSEAETVDEDICDICVGDFAVEVDIMHLVEVSKKS